LPELYSFNIMDLSLGLCYHHRYCFVVIISEEMMVEGFKKRIPAAFLRNLAWNLNR
jgi:hypothetical protein